MTLFNSKRFLVKCSAFRRVHPTIWKCFYSTDRPSWVKFSRAQHGEFTQSEPVLSNQFTGDNHLQNFFKRCVPKDVITAITPDLERFGGRIASEIDQLGVACEQQPPKMRAQNAWGRRVNELWTCDAWKRQKCISAEEGIVSVAYDRSKIGEWSRFYQLIKLYLYAPSSGLYSCPLAMTDGCTKTLESLNCIYDQKNGFDDVYSRLTSRDPKHFWTSGQWMTERAGGSDVADGTQTTAVKQPDGTYRLYGYKWFSSATDADVTLALARVADKDGNTVSGTKGLSLFLLRLRNPKTGQLDNIEIVRLKEKLGTRQLPTAELLLDGATGRMVGEEGRGVPNISHMLTITRIYNSTCSVASMRRMLNLARDYAYRRRCFSKDIHDHPLHIYTLAQMEIETRGCALFVFRLGHLLGKQECKTATDEELHLLRLLVPVSKLYTAKHSVAISSEGLEAFGGQGYMEDTNIPVILRDAQVLPIWEGTTNILSLDVLRSVAKSKGDVLRAFASDVHRMLQTAKENTECKDIAAKLGDALNATLQAFKKNKSF